MIHHLHQEITLLKKQVAAQATMVEQAVRQTLRAMEEKNATLAVEIIERDDTIDQEEVRLEEECLKVLALHQPVAGDLRYIVTLLKVNTELERIGDLAVNIAERTVHFLETNADMSKIDMKPMFLEVLNSLKNALDAFLERDCYLASQVIASDDKVDDYHRENFQTVSRLLSEETREVGSLLDFLNISRNLERIADCCTNIGEDVLYLEQGRIVRHVHEK